MKEIIYKLRKTIHTHKRLIKNGDNVMFRKNAIASIEATIDKLLIHSH